MPRFILLFIVVVFGMGTPTYASETRGLRVVAKDPATNQTGEVKLYNKSYAVIIGIDTYPNLPPDRQLQNAVKDAKGVQEVLARRYQFDRVITLYDEQATKDRIMELLTEELPAEMGKDDALFVFWAGHGNQERSDYGDLGYLIPFDGSTDKIRKNLTMAEIRDTISKRLPAKHVFYVMDACYSGLLTSRSVDNKTRRDLDYLKTITKESVRQVLTAGGKNEEALDGGPKGHSVFSGRFIELLENSDDFITANELQASIRERVYSDAKARNHTQTPGFGPLYGLGDFVFVPKHTDRLGNLTGESLSRQKELEQLRKAEQEAIAAKQKEQAEIALKQKELGALDKQIAEMKERLGSGAARSSDSLDQLLALAEQKELQGQHLAELRQQREAEERNRQQEIERLKGEAIEKRRRQVESDLAKYKKIAASKYAQDMKLTAWSALVASYPEAKGVPQYDEKAFCRALGLVVSRSTDASTGQILAEVNGTAITTGDFDRELKNLPEYLKAMAMTPQGRKEMLDTMIVRELILQQANKDGFDQGSDLDDKIEELKKRLVVETFVKKKVEEQAPVSDVEIQNFYEQNKEKFEVSEEVRASHILLKSEQEAKDVLEKVRNDEEFETLAKKFSIDSSANKGGDLGWFGKGAMVPEFEQATYALMLGQVSDVIKTNFGYHLIKLTGKRPAGVRTLDEVKDQIRAAILPTKQQEVFQKVKEDLKKISTYSIREDVLMSLGNIPSEGKRAKKHNMVEREKKTHLASQALAEVNGTAITVGDFDRELKNLPEYLKATTNTPQGRREMLDTMIVRELILQQAKKDGLDRGSELEDKIEELKKRVIVEAFLKKKVEKQGTASNQELKKFYDQNKDKFKAGEEIRASHILLKSEQEAESVLAKIKRGGKFEALAKQYSIDSTASKGGDLGWFGKGKMVPDFEQATFALKQGQVSGVIKTNFGYHLIKLTGKRPPGIRPFDEVKDQIEASLEPTKQQKVFQKVKDDLKKNSTYSIKEDVLNGLSSLLESPQAR